MAEVTIVRFDGDNLQAVRENGQVWVVVKRVCDALGIELAAQSVKLRGKPWACVSNIETHDTTGRKQELFCLDLDSLPMWLATIEVGRVRPEAREKLIAYQRECARVLRDHFFGRQAAPAGDYVDRGTFERFATQVLDAITRIADRVAALEERIPTIEHRLLASVHEHGMISVDEHRRIQSEVKSLALLEKMTGRHKSTRAASADIYREMGRVAGWGGKGQAWNRLPVQLLQPALAVVAGRRSDAERAARNTRQLSLVPAAQTH